MFRVCAVSVVTLGLLLLAASTQAQQPNMYGPMPGYGPQGPMPGGYAPQAFDPAFAQAMYAQQMMSPYGAAPAQYQNQGPIIAGPPLGMPGGYSDCGISDCDCGCDCAGPCGGGCGKCDFGVAPPCLCPPHDHCPIVFNAEIETGFFMPDFNSNLAINGLASSLPAAALVTSDNADLENEVFVTPRLYLHAQKCEWGIGYRMFYIDESVANFSPIDPISLNIFSEYAENRLQLFYNDLEATYGWAKAHDGCGCCGIKGASVQLSVGARYLELETDSVAIGSAQLLNIVGVNTAFARSQFDGIGGTAGIRGSVLVSHNVSLFASARGSVLGGDLDLQTQTSSSLAGGGLGAATIASNGVEGSEPLVIGEFQVGIQYEHPLQCIPARYFFRVAADYQYYNFDSDLLSTSITNVGLAAPPSAAVGVSAAIARAPDLDLIGVSIGTGLVW